MAKANASQVVLERANKSLQGTAASLAKAAADLATFTTTVEATTLKIEDLQLQAAELEARNDVRLRELDAELRLRVKENEDKVLGELLNKGKLANITVAEVATLKAELAAAVAGNEEAVKKAVAETASAAYRDSRAAAAQVEADTKVAVAQKDAEINMQKEKINFLSAQVTQLQAQIEAERQTRLEIAKADSQRQGVTVNNGK